MPKQLQKSGLSPNNQLNKATLQNKTETGKLFSISIGSWCEKNNSTDVSYKQMQHPHRILRKGNRPDPVTRVKHENYFR